jgi:hypothetical protein
MIPAPEFFTLILQSYYEQVGKLKKIRPGAKGTAGPGEECVPLYSDIFRLKVSAAAAKAMTAVTSRMAM